MILKALELKRQGKPARIGPERSRSSRSRSRSSSSPPSASRPTRSSRGHSSDAVIRGVPSARPRHDRAGSLCGPSALMLRLPPFTYLAPRTVDEAVRPAERAGDACWWPAGPISIPNMKRRQFEPKTLVGLRAIPELRGVRGSARDGLTHRRRRPRCRRSPRIRRSRAHYPARGHRRRARVVAAAPQHGDDRRQRVRGHALQLLQPDPRVAEGDRLLHEEGRRHLPGRAGRARAAGRCRRRTRRPRCWSLGARVRLVGAGGERTVPMEALYRDDGIEYLAKRPDEIVTDILLPPADGWRVRLPEAPPARLLRFSRAGRGGGGAPGGRRRARRADRARRRRLAPARGHGRADGAARRAPHPRADRARGRARGRPGASRSTIPTSRIPTGRR